MTQKNLVAQLDMRPQSASEMIKKLEKKQFISRQKDAQDKRGFIISLTEKGRLFWKKVQNKQNLFQAL
ncbi:hypothetical protein ICE98_01589 [Lactococcus lactis]|nr:hypothetical protein [Lactococcus lactis]